MKKAAPKTASKNTRKWSKDVTEHSHALDLEKDVFAGSDPKRIAKSLKHSAEGSTHRKSDPYRSANVDAVLLYQPCRQEPFGDTQKDSRVRKG